MPQWIFVAISMVVPVFLVRQQRSPQVFKSSDLLLAFLIFASYGFIDAFFNELEIKAIHLIETGLTLLVWIPIVRRFPEIATSIITLLGKLLKKLLGFVRPEIANYPKSIAIGISTIIAALLIYGQSPYYDNFLTILMSLGLIILSIIAFSKYGEESVRSFVRSNIFAKQNRNSVAIIAGAIIIGSVLLYINQEKIFKFNQRGNSDYIEWQKSFNQCLSRQNYKESVARSYCNYHYPNPYD